MSENNLSFSISKGPVASHAHDFERKYRSGLENVSEERIDLNIVIEDTPLQTFYEQTFGDAVSKYNEKQKAKGHKERCIGDYLEKVEADKQLNSSYEMVVQIGNKDSNPATDKEQRDLSEKVYRSFVDDFKKKYPQLSVVGAVIHMDEATPHLHLKYVPVARNCSRGLSVQNSFKQALKSLGFTHVNELNASLFETLGEAAARDGVSRLDMNCHRGRYDVREFKEISREIEAETYTFKNDPRILGLLDDAEQIIEQQADEIEKVEQMVDEYVQTPRMQRSFSEFKEMWNDARIKEERHRLLKKARSFKPLIQEVVDTWRRYIVNPVKRAITALESVSPWVSKEVVPEKDYDLSAEIERRVSQPRTFADRKAGLMGHQGSGRGAGRGR